MTTLTAARSAVRLDDVTHIRIRGTEVHHALASIDGVLDLLERQCDAPDNTFNAFCLLCVVRGQLEQVLRDELADLPRGARGHLPA